MLRLLLSALAIGYAPGALLYRSPIGDRHRRAALGADERVFWHIVLSVAWSLAVVLVLAACNVYQFQSLVVANVVVTLGIVLIGRSRLLYRGTASRAHWTALLPLVLIALSFWRFFPSAEYIIGGKDPGSYLNEGIQLAKQGSLVIREAVVAAVPPESRDLFFPSYHVSEYYGLRFMGFFLQDPASGRTVGQFPHLFPASIAIGYALDGLSGARETVGIWAVLGVLAVYFAAARLVGRAAAFAGGVLLCLNVLEVWFARWPGAEPIMQALLFAGLLAFARSYDDDRFFAPVAGALMGLLLFLRIDALLAVVAILTAAAALWIVRDQRPRLSFVAPLLVSGLLAAWYYTGLMRAYLTLPQMYLRNLPIAGVAIGTAAALIVVILARRYRARAASLIPWTIIVMGLAAAADAWFFRRQISAPEPRWRWTAAYDAFALRTFVDFFLFRWGLVAALAGFVLTVRRHFWRDPALILTLMSFSVYFFYKIRIQPFHFWMDRRFIPEILPGAMLFIGVAAVGWMTMGEAGRWRRAAVGLTVAGTVFLALLGRAYAVAASPVIPHVEYRGIIEPIRDLAAYFSTRDLVIVEGRDSGADTHVLATPLEYIYGRNVLLLNSPQPDKSQLRAFLADALRRYEHVFFVGGGGTDLLSRHILATPAGRDTPIRVPEYESSPWNVYPTQVRRKDFDYTIYELSLGTAAATDGFALNLGEKDDLNVVRFWAKEETEGKPVRWTRRASQISIPGLVGRETEVVLVMKDGGRPATAGPALVQVSFNGIDLGTVTVGSTFAPYRLPIPADAVRRAALADDPAIVRIASTTWNPQQLLGQPDARDLGVMIRRIEVH